MSQHQRDIPSHYYRANNSCLLSTRSRLYISIEMDMSDQTKWGHDDVLWHM